MGSLKARPNRRGLLIFTLPLGFGLFLQANVYRESRNIAPWERTAFGTVTAHDSSNHNMYRYRFEVDGETYEGARNGVGCSAWSDPTVGQVVKVYYDPRHPKSSSLCSFSEISSSARRDVILFCSLVLFVVVLSILRNPFSHKSNTSVS